MIAGGPPIAITGSMMRDMTKCEHRVALDLHGDQSQRDTVGVFTAMLWADGLDHERDVLSPIAADALDLRGRDGPCREAATGAALASGVATILGGRIRHLDMLGDPDLLVRDGAGWLAGDVKSGAALQDGRPRRTYAAQIAHYAAILAGLGVGDGRTAFVVGRDGMRVDYSLGEPAGPRTPPPIEAHDVLLRRARAIRDGAPTRPALAAECKGCHWKSVCKARLLADDDLTLVSELGRGARDVLSAHVPTVAALAALDPAALALGGGPAVKGVGTARLARFAERARLLTRPDARAYARAPLPLAPADHEFFLDIEADPLDDDLVYLHGILERSGGPAGTERFHAFFADEGRAGERDAFAAALRLLATDPAAPVYVYSAYERVSYLRLQRRYPDVCSVADIEALFEPRRTVDLLTAVVRPLTEWPAHDRSIKSLARLCGFEWRDADPSGANSIEWHRTWTRTRDVAVRERIIRYNEDDVIASRVLLDALIGLPIGGP